MSYVWYLGNEHLHPRCPYYHVYTVYIIIELTPWASNDKNRLFAMIKTDCELIGWCPHSALWIYWMRLQLANLIPQLRAPEDLILQAINSQVLFSYTTILGGKWIVSYIQMNNRLCTQSLYIRPKRRKRENKKCNFLRLTILSNSSLASLEQVS